MTAAEQAIQIKQLVSMADVLYRYTNLKLVRNRCACPLHGGTSNNFQVYDGSFYCFSCGKGGDTIKFVSLLFLISYSEAVKKLDTDFNLCIFKKPTLTQYRKSAEENKRVLAERERKNKDHEYLKYGYRKLVDYRFWLLEQPESKNKRHDLAYMDRLLDKFLDKNSIIPFDVDALIPTLKEKFTGKEAKI